MIDEHPGNVVAMRVRLFVLQSGLSILPILLQLFCPGMIHILQMNPILRFSNLNSLPHFISTQQQLIQQIVSLALNIKPFRLVQHPQLNRQHRQFRLLWQTLIFHGQPQRSRSPRIAHLPQTNPGNVQASRLHAHLRQAAPNSDALHALY